MTRQQVIGTALAFVLGAGGVKLYDSMTVPNLQAVSDFSVAVNAPGDFVPIGTVDMDAPIPGSWAKVYVDPQDAAGDSMVVARFPLHGEVRLIQTPTVRIEVARPSAPDLFDVWYSHEPHLWPDPSLEPLAWTLRPLVGTGFPGSARWAGSITSGQTCDDIQAWPVIPSPGGSDQ